MRQNHITLGRLSKTPYTVTSAGIGTTVVNYDPRTMGDVLVLNYTSTTSLWGWKIVFAAGSSALHSDGDTLTVHSIGADLPITFIGDTHYIERHAAQGTTRLVFLNGRWRVDYGYEDPLSHLKRWHAVAQTPSLTTSTTHSGYQNFSGGLIHGVYHRNLVAVGPDSMDVVSTSDGNRMFTWTPQDNYYYLAWNHVCTNPQGYTFFVINASPNSTTAQQQLGIIAPSSWTLVGSSLLATGQVVNGVSWDPVQERFVLGVIDTTTSPHKFYVITTEAGSFSLSSSAKINLPASTVAESYTGCGRQVYNAPTEGTYHVVFSNSGPENISFIKSNSSNNLCTLETTLSTATSGSVSYAGVDTNTWFDQTTGYVYVKSTDDNGNHKFWSNYGSDTGWAVYTMPTKFPNLFAMNNNNSAASLRTYKASTFFDTGSVSGQATHVCIQPYRNHWVMAVANFTRLSGYATQNYLLYSSADHGRTWNLVFELHRGVGDGDDNFRRVYCQPMQFDQGCIYSILDSGLADNFWSFS